MRLNTGAAKRKKFGRKQIRQFRQGRVNARKYLAQENRMRSARSRRLQKKLETAFRRDLRIIVSEVKAGVRPAFGQSVRRKENEIRAAVRAETKKLFNNIVDNNDRKYKPVFTKAAVDLGFGFDRSFAIDTWNDVYFSAREPILANISQSMTIKIFNDINTLQEEGLGIDPIAREITRKYNNISRKRAALIARTEVHNASGFGQHNYHQGLSSDLGINMTKQWVATLDARTRSAHASMNGVQVSMNEPFKMPNGTEMQYVGDPSGGAANIINCRCAIVYVDADDSVEDVKTDGKMDFAGKGETLALNETIADYEFVMTNQVTTKQLALQKILPIPKFTTAFKKMPSGKMVSRGYYQPNQQRVTTTARDNDGLTLTHEYGHHVDYSLLKKSGMDGIDPLPSTYAFAWSTRSNKFIDAYEKDRKANGFVGRKMPENIRKYRNKLYNEKETPTGRVKRDLKGWDAGYFSDIVDAMSSGKAYSEFGMFGHGKGYYTGRGGKDSRLKETFANLYALRSTKRWKDVEANFPNLAEVFDETVDRALDAN